MIQADPVIVIAGIVSHPLEPQITPTAVRRGKDVPFIEDRLPPEVAEEVSIEPDILGGAVECEMAKA
jgi:hypothetical protein